MKWTCVAPRLASYIDLDHVNDLIEKVACWHYQSSIMNLTPVRKKIFMCEKDFWLHAFIALRSWDSLRVYLLRGHCLVSIFEFFLIESEKHLLHFYFYGFERLAERSLRHSRSSASWVGKRSQILPHNRKIFYWKKKNLLLALMLKKLFSSLTSPLTSHLFFFQSNFHRSSLVVGANAVAESSSLSPTLYGRLILLLRNCNYKGRWLFLLGSAEGFYETAEVWSGYITIGWNNFKESNESIYIQRHYDTVDVKVTLDTK